MWPAIFRKGRFAGVLFSCVLALPVSANAQPVPDPGATPYNYCAVSIHEQQLKDHDGELLFTLWSDDVSSRASGAITVYAGGVEYRIPFDGATAADVRDATVLPTPIVVQFPAAAGFESAYVAALGATACPVHEPALAPRLNLVTHTYDETGLAGYPAWKSVWPAFLARAAALTPLTPQPGVPEIAPACARPYVAAYTLRAVPPQEPFAYDGIVTVRMTIAPDGRVIDTRVDHPGRLPVFDELARAAAQASTYAPQIYRCNAISGTYAFLVQYRAR